MDVRFDFRLKFLTRGGGEMQINIPHARNSATPTQIAAAMQNIISSGVVLSEPRFKYGAALVRTEQKEFDI